MQNMENVEPFYYITERYNKYKGDQNDGTLVCTRQAGNTLRNTIGMAALSVTALSPKYYYYCYQIATATRIGWLFGAVPLLRKYGTLEMSSPPNTQKSQERVSEMNDLGKSPPLRNNAIPVEYAGPECVSANGGLLLYQNDGIAKG